MKIKLLISVVFSSFFCSMLYGSTNYVALSGSPNGNYFTDIQSAVDASSPGDLVLVSNGEYIIHSTITVDKPISIVSVFGSDTTIIDAGSHCRCFYLSNDVIFISGFKIQRGYVESANGSGIFCPGNLPVISNCYIYNNYIDTAGRGAGVYKCSVYNSIIEDNSIPTTLSGGTINSEGGGAYASVICNSLITGNSAERGGGARNSTLRNCSVVGNYARYGGGAYNGFAFNSIIWDNNALSVSDNYYNSNLKFSCSFPLPNGEGNISNAPEFITTIDKKWRLKSISPCINAGTNAWAQLPFDLDGFPRIINKTVDMGCYEYTYPPFIDITNAPAVISYSKDSALISGTNLNIAGPILYMVNSKHSNITNLLFKGFSTTVYFLEHGDNFITIFGTNSCNQSTNFVVCIHRKMWIESAPRIATNALVFPCAVAQLLAPFPTNIIWLTDKIIDETDGTNLVITKISVHLAGNSNEVANVTNDISNLLGEISWLVPESLIGNETNYVLRFEVVDSESLTNSRIFTDNEFTIIPEPCFYLLFIILLFINRKLIPKHFTIGMNL